jgi:gliding motility-associated-like protein
MNYKLTMWLICIVGIFSYSTACCQSQTCPANINFATGDLSLWSAKTGLLSGSSKQYPTPNSGVSNIPEYNISTTGIKVITSSTIDQYGRFPTIPTINGYTYNYSVQLGSTATSYDLRANSPNPGGFSRAITYVINVPAGPASEPYTMTYAYAMVLENGTHNSNEQPLFKATLSVNGSIIDCASPQYYLPTFNDATGGGGGGGSSTGATLDTAKALANGFTNSPVPFLSHAGQQGNTGTLLYDVWTKGWTEVTFDLSPYRGRQVSLTFEADNCLPGAHFAYAYVALRNTCAGLQISGNTQACANTSLTYSIPALAGATYNWKVPSGWTINSGSNTNVINVTPGTTGGNITVNEVNGCADLKDTITVAVNPPTVAGKVLGEHTVCSGTNTTTLTLNGSAGDVLKWLYSTDDNQWNTLSHTSKSYIAENLTATTKYKAIVQNGSACSIDTSTAATIVVDPKSVGGTLSPDNLDVCIGQSFNSTFQLTGNTGTVSNWQYSHDQVNWTPFSPAITDPVYSVSNLNSDMYYRAVVKSGVCPADISSVASAHLLNAVFPNASIEPKSASICYGKSTLLNVTITNGTSYSWSPSSTLKNHGNGNISSLPYQVQATATPAATTDYVLKVFNSGCPNAWSDTFHVAVTPPIRVFAGNDTMITANQPLQLKAVVNNPDANQFTWSPVTGLNSAIIQDPIALLNTTLEAGQITYVVRATNAAGCYGEDNITVKVFRTGPEIFVPTGFTPNRDGHNDVIKPILVGIKQLNYFRIYNRWGQVVFSTTENGKGWDGRISGHEQPVGNFVYVVQGIDYTGKVINKKGTIMLIR